MGAWKDTGMGLGARAGAASNSATGAAAVGEGHDSWEETESHLRV